jgi:hypothetical protein
VIRFETHYGEIEACEGGYFVSGRNLGDETIRVGDSLNGLTVSAIESFGRPVAECPPGMGAKLTLTVTRSPGVHGRRYELPLVLGSDGARSGE